LDKRLFYGKYFTTSVTDILKGFLMNNKKTLTFFLVLTILTSCSSNINPVTKTDKPTYKENISKGQNIILSEKEIAGFNKEYSFSTKALTQLYLRRKLDKLLIEPVKSTLLVKEIAYAKFKHPDTFCTIISEDTTGMLDKINAVQEVKDRIAIDTPFKDFLDNCNSSISPPGFVTTVAGDGTSGWLDAKGTNAEFAYCEGVAADGKGNIYVADYENNRIRKVTSSGDVTTFAGDGTAGWLDATGTNAQFKNPFGVAVDTSGNVYVSDNQNNMIRKITSDGVVTTLAGDGTAGWRDATGTDAEFNHPIGIAVDSAGNVYAGDDQNNMVRKITPTGVVTTLAGDGNPGWIDGTGTNAELNSPVGIAVDGSGNVFVGDTGNFRIRKITPEGVVTTVAGDGNQGYIDATGTNAEFNYPYGISADSVGNVYVGDYGNQRIRKVTPDGVVTTVAGDGTTGWLDGAVTSAQFNSPEAVGLDGLGHLYVVDSANYRIRKITL
jgi:hypothetical protein